MISKDIFNGQILRDFEQKLLPVFLEEINSKQYRFSCIRDLKPEPKLRKGQIICLGKDSEFSMRAGIAPSTDAAIVESMIFDDGFFRYEILYYPEREIIKGDEFLGEQITIHYYISIT